MRAEFPALHQQVHGKALVYLDNAATTQKPRAVIDAERAYYEHDNANVHRGVHQLSERATKSYEGAREKIRAFLGAASTQEVVLTRGTTEAINLVAASFVRPRLERGDRVLITHLEHHSNIVPWQLVTEEKGAKLDVAPIDDDGVLDTDAFADLVTERTRFAAFAHVSNALGTVNPVAKLVRICHENGVPALVDGAQAAPHIPMDVGAIGADFYTVSAHKAYGPTGVGALYGRKEHLEAMPPYQGGGDMIRSVSFEKTLWNDLPYKFEAGTPNIAGTIGFGAAIDWLTRLSVPKVAAHEHDLLRYAEERLADVPGLRIIGTAPDKAAVVSFHLDNVHPHDVGTLLDREGVAVRTGHHCAQPVMKRYGVPATTRASFAAYNTHEDVDRLLAGVHKVQGMFA